MKYIKLLIIILLLFLICGCQNKKLGSLSSLKLTGNLVTKKLYFHNVAEYEKKAESGLFHLFDSDQKLWIEYYGIIELGIDLTSVTVETKNNKIYVTIPKAKIINASLENEKDMLFYNVEGGILNSNKLTLEDSTFAMDIAQKAMVDSVNNDKDLLMMSAKCAEALIEEKIKEATGMSTKSYKINWQYSEI